MFSPIYRLSLYCFSSRHPNILGLYGYFWDDTSIYIVMEYGFYGDLKKLLDQHGKFSERRAAWFIARIANAIAYMQDKGVIHRDIKAENVLLGDGVLSTKHSFLVRTQAKRLRMGCSQGKSQPQDALRNGALHASGSGQRKRLWIRGIPFCHYSLG